MFRLAGGLPGRANRSQRLWIVCGSLGAGLKGVELAASHTSDIENLGNGRLAVRVKGPHPRLVPIRTEYTDLARAAINASATDRLVPPDGYDVVHTTARRLRPALSFRRARSTWLVAHLIAGTPLGVLRSISGPLALSTLNELLPFAADAVDEQTAAWGPWAHDPQTAPPTGRTQRAHRFRTRRPQTPAARRFSQRNHTKSQKQSPTVSQTSRQTTRPADRANAGIDHRCPRSRPVPP